MNTFTLFTSFRAKSGKERELFDFLKEVSRVMENYSGCKEYNIYKDAKNTDLVHVFEIWDDSDAHKNSLLDPRVKESIGKGMLLIEKVENQITLLK